MIRKLPFTLTVEKRHRHPAIGRAGFTLVELLVVVVIVVILVCLMLPAVQQAREAARRTQCKNNLMQIGVALSNYAMAHEMLPPGSQNLTGPIRSTKGAGYHMGWLSQILPHLEQQNTYAHIDFTQSVYDPVNVRVWQHVIPQFICPSNPLTSNSMSGGLSCYCGVHNDVETPIDVDQNGVLFLNSSIRYEEVDDGCSDTIFVMETQVSPASDLGWMAGTRSTLRNGVILKPDQLSAETDGRDAEPIYQSHLWPNIYITADLVKQIDRLPSNAELVGGGSSYHTGGFNVLMGDGAVRLINQFIAPGILRKLTHRADGEMMDEY